MYRDPETQKRALLDDRLNWGSRRLSQLEDDLKPLDQPTVRDHPKAVEIRERWERVIALFDTVFGR